MSEEDLAVPRSIRDKLEKSLGKKTVSLIHPQDYEIDKYASIWNQLRVAWNNFHEIKKTLGKDGEPVGIISQNQIPPELKRYTLSIDNLLEELNGLEEIGEKEGVKFSKTEKPPGLYDIVIPDVEKMKYKYGDKPEEEINS